MNQSQANEHSEAQAVKQADKEAQPGKEASISSVLGECIWLLGRSLPHSFLFVRDLDWMLYPALRRKQLFVFHNPEGQPVACVLWAHVNDETENRLRNGLNKLKPEEWDNGENLWIVELIAPFGKTDLIMEEIKNTLFQKKRFRYVKRAGDGKLDVITENDEQTEPATK